MADRMTDHDSKDAQESGRPVQLDREQPGGKPGQREGGQPDRPQHDKQGAEHGQKPGQPQPNR
jgi:hypothetical protein